MIRAKKEQFKCLQRLVQEEDEKAKRQGKTGWLLSVEG